MFKDQKDIVVKFNAHGVKYLVIGAHAVGIYAEPQLREAASVSKSHRKLAPKSRRKRQK